MLIEKCLCGNDRFSLTFNVNDLDFIECDCGVAHLWTDISAADYEAQYRGDYHASSDRHPGCVPYKDRYHHDRRLAAQRFRIYRAIARANGLTTIGSALDVGASNGAFVDHLHARGVTAIGIDPDPNMAREHIFTATTHGVVGSFDLLTYHDVLEHLLDPAGEIGRAFDLLNGGGILVVDVPDVATSAGLHHFKAEHPWYFTEQAIANLFFAAGLDWLETRQPIPGKMVVYGTRLT